jgi:rod shape-determining protein MreC
MALIASRPGYLLLAFIVGHVVLISAQVNTKNGVPILREVTFGAFSEVQRGGSSIVGGTRSIWSNYFALRGVRAENDALRQQLAEARIQLQEQRALADRTRGLEALLELRDRAQLSTTAAEIIAAGATPDFRTVIIDKGRMDGLKADMAVLAPAGVVGRIVVTGPRASTVQLLVDRNAGAGALVERSRAQGVVMGASGDLLRMEYVSEVSDVVVGDTVVTSGIDGIFPKGFAIGRVEVVEKSGGAYRNILVRPAVTFSNLEEVLVVRNLAPSHDVTPEPAK